MYFMFYVFSLFVFSYICVQNNYMQLTQNSLTTSCTTFIFFCSSSLLPYLSHSVLSIVLGFCASKTIFTIHDLLGMCFKMSTYYINLLWKLNIKQHFTTSKSIHLPCLTLFSLLSMNYLFVYCLLIFVDCEFHDNQNSVCLFSVVSLMSSILQELNKYLLRNKYELNILTLQSISKSVNSFYLKSALYPINVTQWSSTRGDFVVQVSFYNVWKHF